MRSEVQVVWQKVFEGKIKIKGASSVRFFFVRKSRFKFILQNIKST